MINLCVLGYAQERTLLLVLLVRDARSVLPLDTIKHIKHRLHDDTALSSHSSSNLRTHQDPTIHLDLCIYSSSKHIVILQPIGLRCVTALASAYNIPSTVGSLVRCRRPHARSLDKSRCYPPQQHAHIINSSVLGGDNVGCDAWWMDL